MSSNSCIHCNTGLALIVTHNNIITKVNDDFVQLTGYHSSYVVDKSIYELFDLLKLKLPTSHQDYSHLSHKFILTKYMHTKEVHVQTSKCYDSSERIYLLGENTELNLEDYFSDIEQSCKHDNSALAIYRVQDFILLKANASHLKLLDGTFNDFREAFARPLNNLMPSPYYKVIEEAINDCISNNHQVRIKEFAYKYNDTDIYLDLYITPLYLGNQTECVVLRSIDITDKIKDRKLMEDTAELFNVFALPVIRLSYPDLTILDVNNTASLYIANTISNKMVDKSYLKTKSLYELLSKSELNEYRKYIQDMFTNEKTVHLNKHKVFNNNTTYYFNFIFQPIFNTVGSINELLITIIDVTKEVEQELLMEKNMRMKDDFISFLSHEFKTPLTVIYSAVQAIELIHKKELPLKSIKYIDKIHQNTLRQLRLVNNLLDITRSEAGYLKTHKRNADIVSISRAIVDSVSIYAEEKNVKLKFKSSLPYKLVALDDEKFERILLNLLSNAIKFTPAGKCVYTNVSSKNRKICIEVKDEGIGIPKEKLNIIFDRFGQVESKLTRNSEGTGIGLYLAKQLATALGGDIIVESSENKGSSFKLFLDDSINHEETEENILVSSCNGRLINSTAIEFSDIYSF